ncbi:MAG: signal peptidase I [Clostridia bacterium]|nr:signal peptidase I [Clostridia bacterium]
MKRVLINILIIIIILIILINIFSALGIPFLGIRVFKVASGSMEPYLKINDWIIIKSSKNYSENDIVSFEDGNYYTTHRIVKIENNIVTTKGDNNNTNDEPITMDKIKGKLLFRIRLLRFVNYLLTKPISWALIPIIGFLIIYLTAPKVKKPI